MEDGRFQQPRDRCAAWLRGAHCGAQASLDSSALVCGEANMRGAEPSDIPDLPATLVILLERACDRFEAAWRAGLRPRIEDYLEEIPAAGRATLQRELEAL